MLHQQFANIGMPPKQKVESRSRRQRVIVFAGANTLKI